MIMDLHLLIEISVGIFALCIGMTYIRKTRSRNQEQYVMMFGGRVNYFLTRQCNYHCKFCYHTPKTSFKLRLEDAKRGLKILSNHGMTKINFAGGEPLLENRGKYVGELAKYCKNVLKTRTVCIITNGSLLTEKWFKMYSKHIDILSISNDSFDAKVLLAIGRISIKNKKQKKELFHLEQLFRIKHWCLKYDVAFKIITVVQQANKNENMVKEIADLAPIRWKLFQCMIVTNENDGNDSIRDARNMVVNDEDFDRFVKRHEQLQTVVSVVPVSNKVLCEYMLVDEYFRVLDNCEAKKIPSKSILDVGLENALKFQEFDEESWLQQGGVFKFDPMTNTYEW